LVTYYKTSGITCLQKHLHANHLVIYKRFQEKINNQGEENVERQKQRKGLLFPILPYLNFLLQKIPSKRMMWSKRCLWKFLHF
jgi:hypothetical protein